MNVIIDFKVFIDYVVVDMVLVGWGCKEFNIVEIEMLGFVQICDEYKVQQLLKGVCIVGLLYMMIQMGVLIEMLKVFGVDVCWVLCNIFLIQDYVVVVIVEVGMLVFVFKGELFDEYWEFLYCIFEWLNGEFVNMIFDDGGDVMLLLIFGLKVEKDCLVIVKLINEEEVVLYKLIVKYFDVDVIWYLKCFVYIKGVIEEIMIGVYCLYQMEKDGCLLFLVFNVNDLVMKLKFDNLYGCCELFVDGIKCVIDVMIVGKVVVVVGYGDVGKGCVQLLCGFGVIVWVIEIDLICVLQVVMEGYCVVMMEYVVDKVDIFVMVIGNYYVINYDYMKVMCYNVIVCNIGYFDLEIDVVLMCQYQWENIKLQVDYIIFLDGKCVILLVEGCFVNFGCVIGYLLFVMLNLFVNQMFVQIELFMCGEQYENKVYVLLKYFDEKVVCLYFVCIGVNLLVLLDEQVVYIGVQKDGLFKLNYYCY